MNELTQEDFEKIQKIIVGMEQHQALLRKNVVHPLRGTSVDKISDTKYKEAGNFAKRVLDHHDKQLKILKKLFR